jgi:putative ABC transport system permease protein
VDALAGNTVIKQTFTPAPMPAAMSAEFAEIEAITRISSAASGTKVKYENRVFIENSILLVDTTFFDIFSGAFVYGNPDPSILAPNTAIMTEQTARKYFGDINPIGKVITVDETRQMTITAVIKEFPKNSHFHFDMLISLLSYDGFYNNPQWFANNFRTYLLLHPNQDYMKLEAKLPAFVDKYLFEGKYQERATTGNKWEYGNGEVCHTRPGDWCP